MAIESERKFKVNQSVWYTLPIRGSVEVVIVDWKKDVDEDFVYQVKQGGVLQEKWVAQEKLSECQ